MILHGTDYEKYYWNIAENEILNADCSDFLDLKKSYTGKEFEQLISHDEYSVIYINAKASSEPCNEEIRVYEDFLKSSYIIVLLCYDDMFFEIFSKDLNFIQKIKSNIIHLECFENIEYITDANDERTGMSV